MEEKDSLEKYLGQRACVKCGRKTTFTQDTKYARLVRQICHECFKEVKQAEFPMPDRWGEHRRAFKCGGGYRILRDTAFLQ